MASELFYQAIQKVPGLKGSRYQDKGKDLYYKMGAPFGAYKGNLQQNSWLLNGIRKNNYYSASQPWNPQPAAPPAAAIDPRAGIADATLNKVEPIKNFQDVMPRETWYGVFDEWTRNFANEYVLPEWQEQTYNPAMEDMTRGLGNLNQQMGVSGAWRSGTAQDSLRRAAEESIKEEGLLRQQYQSDIAKLRDQIKTSWALPTYEDQMRGFSGSPLTGMNLGNAGGDTGINAQQMVQNLSSQYGVTNTNKLGELISGLGDWDPTQTPDATTYDWRVPQGNMSLLEQYR